MARPKGPAWVEWLRRWDLQQQSYFAGREDRFRLMIDLVEAQGRRAPTVLDLGCGPGSLSARLLSRLPRARSIGVDLDPVLLRLGRETLGDAGGRMRWVEADLRRADWWEKLPERKFDAALSTTALHWLPPPALRRLYRDLYHLLRPEGIFLNGDHLPLRGEGSRIEGLYREVVERHRPGRGRATWLRWEGWWQGIEKEPVLRELFDLRRARFPKLHPREVHLAFEDHAAALRRAGFSEVGLPASTFAGRLLLAVR